MEGSTSFTLSFLNPCEDNAFVSIVEEDLQDVAYELFEFGPDGKPFTHDVFVVSTTPISHDFCGLASYSSTFEDVAVDTTTSPVSYDVTTLTHKVYSEDVENRQGNTYSYTVTASLPSYP